MSRSRRTINHPENTRTGTSALGRYRSSRRPLHRGHRYARRSKCLAATAELRVINLIAEQDVETDEELASEGDFSLRPSASMQHGKVTATEILVRAGGERS